MDWVKRAFESAISITAIFLLASHVRATPLKGGDVIVSWAGYPSSYVQEYTSTGSLVQSWNVTSQFSTEYARDVGVDGSGNIIIYNGTFSPFLTILNPITGAKTNYSFSGWNTDNNATEGALAVWRGYAFATDDEISNDGPNQNGIVRFNLANGTAQRFLAGTNTTSVGIGLNNDLYAVWPNTSPGQNQLDIIDAATMAVEKTVSLPMGVSGATADVAGNIYVTSGSAIYKLDSNGNILGHLETPFALDNIKIFTTPNSTTDQLIMANNGGQIVMSNTNLTSFSEFTLNEPGAQLYSSYATFVPEPAPIVMLAAGAIGLLLIRRRKPATFGPAFATVNRRTP